MRKHNRKFALRMGSARVDSSVPRMAHAITNSKGFQLAANPLLQGLLCRAGLPKVTVAL